MKKLLMAVAIVCAAVVSHGAAVVWDAGTITDANGNTAGKAQVTGYLFALTEAQYADYSAMDAAALSEAIYKDFGGSTGSAVTTGTSTKKGALSLEGIDATAGTPVYGAVLYIDNTIGENPYYMGNVATVTWSGVSDPAISELANAIGGSGAATSWQTAAVPEPTSGLLLLLGVAGMALRRRRA